MPDGNPRVGAALISCRSCGSSGLQEIISLGEIPLANSLLGAEQLEEPEARYPLEVVFCPICSLVQITATVAPELLFRNYLYFSSFSATMMGATGPNVSSLKTLMSRVTFPRTVGWKYRPSWPPPHRTSAPLATASCT